VTSGDAGPEVVARLAVAMNTALGRVIGPDENFFEAGLDSVTLVRSYQDATAAGDPPFPVTVLFARPNLRALTRYLTGAAVAAAAPGRHAGAGPAADARRRALARRRTRPRPEGER
jgi:hypothetical protein